MAVPRSLDDRVNSARSVLKRCYGATAASDEQWRLHEEIIKVSVSGALKCALVFNRTTVVSRCAVISAAR